MDILFDTFKEIARLHAENGAPTMDIETKQSPKRDDLRATAENVMDRNCLIIPQQRPVRQAAHSLHRQAVPRGSRGRREWAVRRGVLRTADVFRWIDADCPKAVIGTPVTCPYQVQGRLLNGDEALICTLSHGSCGFQTEVPTTGGRHTDICVRQETADFPFGGIPGYMTKDFISISSRSKLVEMVCASSIVVPMD